MRHILEKKEFTQRGISKATGASLGGVNYTVKWLLSRGYLAKSEKGYRLVAAAGVLSLFPLDRKMEELRVASFDVEVDRKRLLDMLQEEGAALCLTSALQHYDSYFRDSAICVYSDSKELLAELSKLRKGYVRVEIYRDDIGSKEDMTAKGGTKLTTQLRTVIDLFCSDRAYTAERLVARMW